MDVSIALGGGGSRGAAHIGVLRALQSSGIRVRAVSGTSIGSVVASFFAFGLTPDQIETAFSSVDQAKLYGWPLSDGPGLLGVRGIYDFLKSQIGDVTFENLKLPCAAVAIDLKSNREIFLRRGSVLDAIMGSIAVPGLFPPKELDGYSLIDGGTLDPIPVRAARDLAPDLPVIAVTLMAPLEMPATSIGIVSLPSENSFVKQIARMNITQAFRIFADSVDIASRQMAELRLSLDDPELIIRPDVNGINLLDSINVHEIARLGEIATERALPDLFRSLSLSARMTRQVRRMLRRI
ncbi:MAG: patatin-like phospholipase family protein [Chloroflexi bacterium]|nr:patatin-like phospholipase family protein [Chloroflexota bacterium]